MTSDKNYTGADLQFREIWCLSHESTTELPLKTIIPHMGMCIVVRENNLFTVHLEYYLNNLDFKKIIF